VKYLISISLFVISAFSIAQKGSVSGVIGNGKDPMPMVKVVVLGQNTGAYTDDFGKYKIENLSFGTHEIQANISGYNTDIKTVSLSKSTPDAKLDFIINLNIQSLGEVVVSGTMKAVGKLDSPVPVEVYSTCFFQSNPSPTMFDAIQNINGVRPQLNCNICNTGDIHINGLEGPYTMVLIDGMPIVSGLSSVYGLSGIPQSLVDRIEVVKGPASTLYGSEAVGGLINIITKRPSKAPIVAIDHFSTSWGELNNDLSMKYKAGKNSSGLLGVNYFNYSNPIDNNGDGFTDLTLQDRISIFNKFDIQQKNGKTIQLAGRYVHEDRWGGQTNWTPEFRGGDSIYGESIYTSRWETMGTYQLPAKEDLVFQFSANGHNQNSFYGTTEYMATQQILFGQLLWNKSRGRHDVLAGLSYRRIFYDDNTPATSSSNENNQTVNNASISDLPGMFVQNDWTLNEQNRLLVGLRYDYNSIHGSIFSPRVNYKWTSQNNRNIIRVSAGNGYRVANVFTEDHAALTGARKIVFAEELRPETSYNTNLNFVKQIQTRRNHILTFDASIFYTYFENKILPDYETDPNLIIYSNLSGFAESKGVSLNMDLAFGRNLSVNVGTTILNVSTVDNGVRSIQPLTESITGTWRIHYNLERWNLAFDYTGNMYGPMRLPLLGELDNRDAYSPYFSIQNLQLVKSFGEKWEVYGGVKNLLNFTPSANSIARAFDPFDKQVQFDATGQVVATPNNPNALTFDPSYVYTSNQGIRAFLGFRFTFK
jgi:outer membrane receptor for ferrienterochelin and colicins